MTISQYNNLRTVVDLTCVYSDANNVGCATVTGEVIGYRITLQALLAPARAYTARPCIQAGGVCPPGSYRDASTIVVDATGNQGQARAIKQAQVLWQLPSSGVFNFVIFTEGGLVPPT